jgi:membrane fusion protein (multidrug efflux system)
MMKKWGLRGLVLAAVLFGAVYGMHYFIRSLSYEKVDDARVAGTIVPIAAEVKGRVVKIHFRENQAVRAGAPLVEIASEDYASLYLEKEAALNRLYTEEREIQAALEEKKKALSQVKAAYAAAEAEEILAEKEETRQKRLYEEGLITTSQIERAESSRKVAQARKEAAGAAVAGAETAIKALEARLSTQASRIREAALIRDRARLELNKTVLTAPIEGIIAMKNVDVGKWVQPGQTLLAIVKKEVWITANFKETQIRKMTVGQPVRIKVDAYPGKVFRGRVDSLQPGTGSVFSLLPAENATGNFVKVVQRIPVKIVIDTPFDPEYPLWPGKSVVPEVDVTRKTGPKLAEP